MPQLYIFGDSISWGACDTRGGWAQRIKSEIDYVQLSREDNFCTTFILGVPGETSGGLAQRIEAELQHRSSLTESLTVIVATGINDSKVFFAEPEHNVAADLYLSNLRKILDTVRAARAEPLFISLTPIDEERVNGARQNCRSRFTKARVAEFDSVLRSFVQGSNSRLIDIQKAFSVENVGSLLHDGLHPNTKGHARMYGVIREVLQGEPELQPFFLNDSAAAMKLFGTQS